MAKTINHGANNLFPPQLLLCKKCQQWEKLWEYALNTLPFCSLGPLIAPVVYFVYTRWVGPNRDRPTERREIKKVTKQLKSALYV